MDKLIIKKPILKAQPVAQSTEAADKPIAEESGNNWHIAVYSHSIIKSRFSYQLTINNRLLFNLWHIDDRYPHRFGCFWTPQEAIAAAKEELSE